MTRAVVYHAGHGCDTGCCGHVVELDTGESEFHFSHPYGEDGLEFAKELLRDAFGDEHVADLDWESCVVLDD